MKKAGILTYHSAHNYGAVLQAYALQEAIKESGFDAEFVHFHSLRRERKNRRKVKIRRLRDLPKLANKLIFGRKLTQRFNSFEEFIGKKLLISKRYETPESLKVSPPEVDVLVCGSDQIWNLEQGGSPVFFLEFKSAETPSFSYAASFGHAVIEAKHSEKVKRWMQNFDLLSVREDSAKVELEKLIPDPIEHVLDPVFLHSREFWEKCETKPTISGDYIFFYSLEVTPKVSQTVAEISKMLKMPVVVVGKPGKFLFSCRTIIRIDTGPDEFLGLLSHAKMVVTNSFHATAFSILFGVPFLTVAHSHRNTRMESLLAMAGQTRRLLANESSATDWTKEELLNLDADIAAGLAKEIEKSKQFLKKGLALAL